LVRRRVDYIRFRFADATANLRGFEE